MGVLTTEDRLLIKNLRIEKKWGAKKMSKEFPNKPWKISTVSDLIRKIDLTGGIERTRGSGRPKTIRTAVNINLVRNLIHSPGNAPGTHKSPREIEREATISHSTVRRIIKLDLLMNVYKRIPVQQLSNVNKEKRLHCCMQLLERFPERSVRRIWFTDEKMFTVSTPINSQNDRVYSTACKKINVDSKRILVERSHFSKSIMVSVGVSKMGKTNVVFVEPGAKVNSTYYCEQVLNAGLLPTIREKCGYHNWVLQQDGAPSHRAANTINFLQRENILFIEPNMWPPNSPDLNPVDYSIWGALQQCVYKHRIRDINHLKVVINVEWGKLSQRLVSRSIEQWRSRLEYVVQENGGHIEHIFK
jgi:hypothetical protein